MLLTASRIDVVAKDWIPTVVQYPRKQEGKAMEDEIKELEGQLKQVQSAVATIETNIDLYEKELPKYRHEIELLEQENLATVTELARVVQQEPTTTIERRIVQTEIYCLKCHHSTMLREAIQERNELSRYQDKLIHCLEQWKVKMTLVPELQKRLVGLYKQKREMKNEIKEEYQNERNNQREKKEATEGNDADDR